MFAFLPGSPNIRIELELQGETLQFLFPNQGKDFLFQVLVYEWDDE